jgi:endonuclease YncB( thermonuclease family)
VTAFAYTGTLIRVVDGDTAHLELTSDAVDIGFHVKVSGTSQQTCRLLDCNAREHDQPGGAEAREHLRGLLSAGPLRVVSVSLDNWGRSLCRMYLPDGTSVADLMIAAGFAAAWNGKGVKPVPPWPVPS